MSNTHSIIEVKPVLTIDITDFSTRSNLEQVDAVKALIKIIQTSIPPEYDHPAARVWSPAGDGGSITFWDASIEAALVTAIEIANQARMYNNGEYDQRNYPKPERPLQIRMGIHTGTVTKEIDFDGRENVWGAGINFAGRVMSLCKPDQILISDEYYQNADFRKLVGVEIKRIGKWWTKHNKSFILYNVYVENKAGIPLSEVDEWFGPLHYPLANAIKIYEGMLEEETTLAENPFRVAVIAKRILDLDPENRLARRALESLSRKRHGPGKPLYHTLFSDFSPETILYFFERSSFHTFEIGETIVSEGDIADSMMIIVSGEVKLYKSGEVVKQFTKDPGKKPQDYVFPEGEIIGEMGIFEMGGKRSATLKASKRSIVLSIDYDDIKDTSGALNSSENMLRLEIQRGIWKFYTHREIEHTLITHPLFSDIQPPITESDRFRLSDKASFYPEYFQAAIPDDYRTALELENKKSRPISLKDYLWNSLVIVVNGCITVSSLQKDGETCAIEYGPDKYIGAIRTTLLTASPYTDVDTSPDAQFIAIPWETITELRQRYRALKEKLRDMGDEERSQRKLD